MKPIRFVETTEPPFAPEEGLALRIDPSRHVTLRFKLTLRTPEDTEALRYARRAMIREERTRGLEWDEPSIEHPTITGNELRWVALISQAAWCREKVIELVDRANRAREALEKVDERLLEDRERRHET
jgi:hypothetical protein